MEYRSARRLTKQTLKSRSRMSEMFSRLRGRQDRSFAAVANVGYGLRVAIRRCSSGHNFEVRAAAADGPNPPSADRIRCCGAVHQIGPWPRLQSRTAVEISAYERSHRFGTHRQRGLWRTVHLMSFLRQTKSSALPVVLGRSPTPFVIMRP